MRNRIYIIGTPGSIEQPETHDLSTLIRAVGQNTGNLIFQYAADRCISGSKSFIGLVNTKFRDVGKCRDGKCVIFPAANHLRDGADWDGLCAFLESVDAPLVVLGLGAQAATEDSVDSLVNRLKDSPSVMRLMKVFREKARLVTVRGAFTGQVCRALGLEGVLELGCPSLMISADASLGGAVESSIRQAQKGIPCPIALTAAAPLNLKNDDRVELERALLNWIRDGRSYYYQQSGGEPEFIRCGSCWKDTRVGYLLTVRNKIAPTWPLEEFVDLVKYRSRLRYDAAHWIEELRKVKLTIGTRVHGNMAGLAAGTPGIVVTHDSRTSELVEQMRLPRLMRKDVVESENLQEALGYIRFSADDFDSFRRAAAQRYVDEFRSLGVEPSSHLQSIANFA